MLERYIPNYLTESIDSVDSYFELGILNSSSASENITDSIATHSYSENCVYYVDSSDYSLDEVNLNGAIFNQTEDNENQYFFKPSIKENIENNTIKEFKKNAEQHTSKKINAKKVSLKAKKEKSAPSKPYNTRSRNKRKLSPVSLNTTRLLKNPYSKVYGKSFDLDVRENVFAKVTKTKGSNQCLETNLRRSARSISGTRKPLGWIDMHEYLLPDKSYTKKIDSKSFRKDIEDSIKSPQSSRIGKK